MDENTEELNYLDGEDLTDQQELIEDHNDQTEMDAFSNVPQARKPESLYTLFNRVWKTPDSSKVANLNSVELGQITVSVRDCQYLSLLSSVLKHPKFGWFWKTRGEITLATSPSKKGWFTELFVSQKKFTQRASAVSSPAKQPDKKWIFGKNQQATQAVQE